MLETGRIVHFLAVIRVIVLNDDVVAFVNVAVSWLIVLIVDGR